MKTLFKITSIIFILCLNSFSQTNVSGFISANTTWNVTGSPYIVTGSIIVNSGVILTIEQGVTVKFNSGFAIKIDGTLIAIGTAQNKIIFTSNQPSPVPGGWGYLLFTNASSDAAFDANGNYTGGCILKYCDLLYGGSIFGKGIVSAEQSSPYINNCNIRFSGNSGIYCFGSRARIDSNIITNNSMAGIYFDNYWYDPPGNGNMFIRNNNVSNNGQEGIRLISIQDTTFVLNNIISNNHGDGGLCNGNHNMSDVGALFIKIIGNTVQGNTGTRAGGIMCYQIQYMEITSNIISENTGVDVGGLYTHSFFNPTTLIVNNNTIINNTAQKYGAVYSTFYAGGGYTSTALFNGNTITGNSSSLQGYSAIKLEGDPSYNFNTYNLINNQIRKNTAARTILLSHCRGYLNQNNLDSNNTTFDIYSDNSANAPSFNARRNFWGTTNMNTINSRVYDFFDDPNRGVVLLDSFAINPIGIVKTNELVPKSYILKQNYPNPFNPTTNIEFGISKSSDVTLTIYNLLGEEISELINEKLSAGYYKIEWNASKYPSGAYFYTIKTENYIETKKLMLIK